ncbi:MAG: hypothetical protein HOE11_03395 [Candidatus Diapherotrites archaeon]|jgi:hypothetical protein|nr:hypothetical protein [Candidatus Diapherotrites archaeon]MBT4596415.1 hypothetical protein [Candidatus Diapherotrites archaeon]
MRPTRIGNYKLDTPNVAGLEAMPGLAKCSFSRPARTARSAIIARVRAAQIDAITKALQRLSRLQGKPDVSELRQRANKIFRGEEAPSQELIELTNKVILRDNLHNE